jgi:hypothetical protein
MAKTVDQVVAENLAKIPNTRLREFCKLVLVEAMTRGLPFPDEPLEIPISLIDDEVLIRETEEFVAGLKS